MTQGITENFAQQALEAYLHGTAPPGGAFRVHLVTADTVPDWDADTLGDLTEIAAGSGYPADGFVVERSATGFPTIAARAAEDDVRARIKDTTFTGSGGTIPPSGNPIAYAVLTDANATKASRKVLAWFQPSTTHTIPDGDSLAFAQAAVGQWDLAIAKP